MKKNKHLQKNEASTAAHSTTPSPASAGALSSSASSPAGAVSVSVKPNAEKSKFGILGKDLSSKFSSRKNNFFVPTKPGGRNGQGKPT